MNSVAVLALFSGAVHANVSPHVTDDTLPNAYFGPDDCPVCTVDNHKMLVRYSNADNCVNQRYCVDTSYVHSLDRENHNYHHTTLDTATTCTSDDDCTDGKFCHEGPAGSCQTNHEHFHCHKDSASTCSCACDPGITGKTVDTGDGKRIHDLSATNDRESVTKPTTTDGSRQGERWTFVGMGYGADRSKDQIRNFRGTTASKNVCAQLCEDTATCYGINWLTTTASNNCQVMVHQGYTAGGELLGFVEQNPHGAGPINALLSNDDVECWRYTRHTHPNNFMCPQGFDFENDWCNSAGRCDSSSGRITVSWISSTDCRNACQTAGDSCAGVTINSGECGLVWAGAENPAPGAGAPDIFHEGRGNFQGKIDTTDDSPGICSVRSTPPSTCDVTSITPASNCFAKSGRWWPYDRLGIDTISFGSGSIEGKHCRTTPALVQTAPGTYDYCCTNPAGGLSTDVGGSGIHCFHNINDGKQGNDYSWTPNSAEGYAGFRLDDHNSIFHVNGFCVDGSDNNRCNDELIFEVSTEVNEAGAGPWCQVGVMTRASDCSPLCYQLSTPVKARAVRIKTKSAGGLWTNINELAVFGNPVTADGVCRQKRIFTPCDEERVMSGYPRMMGLPLGINTVSFGSSSIDCCCSNSAGGLSTDVGGSGIHCFQNINDGKLGNSYSWIPNGREGYAGFRLDNHNSVFHVTGFCVSGTGGAAGSEDNRCDDEVEFETSTASDEAGAGPWSKVAVMRRKRDCTRLCYEFSCAVEARAVRVKVKSLSTCNLYSHCGWTNINELAVYGLNPASEVTSVVPSEQSILDSAYTRLGVDQVSFGSSSIDCCCSNSAGGLSTDVRGSGIHCFQNINDGKRTNSYSWIPNGREGYAGFRLDDHNSNFQLKGFCVVGTGGARGADDTRCDDELEFETSTSLNEAGAGPWSKVAVMTRDGDCRPLCYEFSTAVEARAVRIKVKSLSTCNKYSHCGWTNIMELAVYGS